MRPPIPTLQAMLNRPGSHQALIERVLAEAAAPTAACDFTALFAEDALAAARAADEQLARGEPLPPLAGLPVSVKDLFDLAGRTTQAGSVLRRGAPPAVQDAAAVARLRGAGAAANGSTDMTEFAFSGVGINPHFGTPRNTFVANFLDGCAFTLPCHAPGELPVGLMLSAPGGQDAVLAGVSLAVEAVLLAAPAP